MNSNHAIEPSEINEIISLVPVFKSNLPLAIGAYKQAEKLWPGASQKLLKELFSHITTQSEYLNNTVYGHKRFNLDESLAQEIKPRHKCHAKKLLKNLYPIKPTVKPKSDVLATVPVKAGPKVIIKKRRTFSMEAA